MASLLSRLSKNLTMCDVNGTGNAQCVQSFFTFFKKTPCRDKNKKIEAIITIGAKVSCYESMFIAIDNIQLTSHFVLLLNDEHYINEILASLPPLHFDRKGIKVAYFSNSLRQPFF